MYRPLACIIVIKSNSNVYISKIASVLEKKCQILQKLYDSPKKILYRIKLLIKTIFNHNLIWGSY